MDWLIKIQGEYNNDYENEGFCTFCTLCTLHALNALGTLDFQLYFGRPYDTWLPTVLSSVIAILNYIGVGNDAPVFKFKKWQKKMSYHIRFHLYDVPLFEPLWNLFSHITYLLRIYIKIYILTTNVSHIEKTMKWMI